MPDARECFLISPIGAAGSEIRMRADQVRDHLVKPAVTPGYHVVRADELPEPGMITTQIITHVLEAPLVIADLTELNPNVLYELAIRHAARKPLIQIIDVSTRLPFDVQPIRTVFFDWRSIASLNRAQEEIANLVAAVEKDPTLVDNPITMTVDVLALRSSGKTVEAQIATIIETVQGLSSQVSRLTSIVMTPPRIDTDPWGGPRIVPAWDRSPWPAYVESQAKPGDVRSGETGAKK